MSNRLLKENDVVELFTRVDPVTQNRIIETGYFFDLDLYVPPGPQRGLFWQHMDATSVMEALELCAFETAHLMQTIFAEISGYSLPQSGRARRHTVHSYFALRQPVE